MARYNSAHKEQSRSRLIAGAADLFRRRGYRGVGIDELCAAADLTRGAFYAHFKSKQALLQAVLAGSHDFVRRLQARSGGGRRLLKQGVQVARDYLDVRHRTAVLGGCSLAALAMDTARADEATQAAYAHAVQTIVAEFRRDNPEVSADRAHAAVALCVGGLLVGSACGVDPTADRISRAARRHVADLLALPD